MHRWFRLDVCRQFRFCFGSCTKVSRFISEGHGNFFFSLQSLRVSWYFTSQARANESMQLLGARIIKQVFYLAAGLVLYMKPEVRMF